MARLPACTVVFLIVASVLACHEDHAECYQGDFRGCTCSGQDIGYQRCRADGSGFDACVCDGTIPGLDAGGGAEAP